MYKIKNNSLSFALRGPGEKWRYTQNKRNASTSRPDTVMPTGVGGNEHGDSGGGSR